MDPDPGGPETYRFSGSGSATLTMLMSLMMSQLFSFRPDSELYLESLGIICSVPAAWLICTLVILLLYLLTRCCDTKNNKVKHANVMISVRTPVFRIQSHLNPDSGIFLNPDLDPEVAKFKSKPETSIRTFKLHEIFFLFFWDHFGLAGYGFRMDP
jgi:hypothetical protein